nr:hypothetical protein [Bacillus toyonensis]
MFCDLIGGLITVALLFVKNILMDIDLGGINLMSTVITGLYHIFGYLISFIAGIGNGLMLVSHQIIP